MRDRIGSTGNQFAIQTIIALLILIPVMFLREQHLLGEFYHRFRNNSKLSTNLIYSGLTFYVYNELATMTLTKISAITQSIANTAKRVVVIVGCAIVFKEDISRIKAVGCFICIAGVFLDSIIDDILKPRDVVLVADSSNATRKQLNQTPKVVDSDTNTTATKGKRRGKSTDGAVLTNMKKRGKHAETSKQK